MTQDAKKPLAVEGEMSIISHLTELRSRLIISVLAIVAGVVLVWMLFDRIFGFLEAPYCDYQQGRGKECEFLVTSVTEPFSTQLSLSGWGGLILALPIIFYQLARFVMPGLYPGEKRALLVFLPISIGLLLSGMTTAYWLMPKAVEILLGFGAETFDPQLKPSEYVSFFVKMLLAFGIAFQLPVVLVFLQKVGLVQTSTLRKNRRYAAVGVVAAGAIITPTGDPFTLAVISVPMYLFYEISILIGSRLSSTPLLGKTIDY